MAKKNESTLITDQTQAYVMAHQENTIRAMDTSLVKLIEERGISDPVTKSVWIKWVAMIYAFEKVFEVSYL